MLLTIHNLPAHIRVADIKSLILLKCGFSEVILDNLLSEGKTKKVTVGLAEEEDAAILTRTINGLYYEGKQLYVRDVRQKMAFDQPYYKNSSSEPSQDNYQAPTNYQIPNPVQAFQGYQAPGQGNQEMSQAFHPGQFGNPQQMMGPEGMIPMMVAPNMMGGMYFMPQMGNSIMDYNGQQVAAVPPFSQVSGQQEPTGNFGAKSKENPFRENRANRDPSPNPKRGRYEDTSRSNDNIQRKSRESRRRSRSPNRRGLSRDMIGDSNSRTRKHDYQQHDERRDYINPWASRQGGFGSGSFDNNSQGETSQSQFDKSGSGRNNWNNQIPFDNNGQGQRRSNQGSFDNKRQGINPWINQPRSDDNSQEINNLNTQTPFDNSNQNVNSWNSQAFDEHARRNWNKSTSIGREPIDASDTEKSNWIRHQALKNQNQSQSSWNRDNNYSSGNGSKPQSRWGGPAENSQSPDRRNPPNTYGNQDRSQSTWNRSNQSSSNQPQSQRSRFNRGNRAPFDNKSPPKRNVWENSSRQNVEPPPQKTYSNESRSTFQPRSEMPQEASGASQTKPGAGCETPKKELDIATLLRRDAAYKLQAAAELVKDMSKNVKLAIDPMLLKPLKKAVHARLQVLLYDSLGISQMEMVAQYRRRFPRYRDKFLLLSVEQQVEEADQQEEKANPSADVTKRPPAVNPVQGPKVTPSQSSEGPSQGPPAVAPSQASRPTVAPNQASRPTLVPSQSSEAPRPTVAGSQAPRSSAPLKTQGKPPATPAALPQKIPQLLTPTDKLPNYPNADKKVYKALKAQRKAENKDENFYHEDMAAKFPLEEAELLRHADAIGDIVKNELGNPDDENEKSTCAQILKAILAPIRRAVILNVSKRLLDINVGLSVRVFAQGQPPKKAEVEHFMKQFDLVSLKKAKKGLMYVASCRTYRAYDHLCALGSTPLTEFTTLLFKPFQVAGPRMSVRERKQLQQKARNDFLFQTANSGADAEEYTEVWEQCDEGEGQLDEWANEELANEDAAEGPEGDAEVWAEGTEVGAEGTEAEHEVTEAQRELDEWDAQGGEGAVGDGGQDEVDDINNYEDW